MRSFARIAIVNRAEPALRLIHAAREYAYERDVKLTTIALHTDADAGSTFVREADEAVSIGPATWIDESGRRKNSYLDYERLEAALVESRAEAAWVGWGLVAEHAAFAEMCRRLGIVFIGPSPEVMRQLGDKITSKQRAQQADVPVAPWSGGAVETVEDARRIATSLGYPLMVKATSGGGGRGIREVLGPDDLAEAFESARAEAAASFGDATVFLEARVGGARHIEVQIIGDEHGRAWALGVRDCTIQRRHQKVLEESPSPALTDAQARDIMAASVRLAELVGYQNAGTVEFLYDPERRRFSFMEVNARLQVEHPVTELTSGVDLVKLQIDMARGLPLQGDPPTSEGHAVEVRLCAEDPERQFAPAPGRVEQLRLPTGPGIRIDAGVAEGDVIPSEFDSMVAKLIARGRDRDEALARLRRALDETRLVVRGGASNKGFLRALLDRPEVRTGDVDNAWLDGLAQRGEHLSHEGADVALLRAAVFAYEEEFRIELAQFFASARRGRPELRAEIGVPVELGYRGRTYRFVVRRAAPHEYRIDAGSGPIPLRTEPLGDFEARCEVAGRRSSVVCVDQGLEILLEVDGVPHRVSRDSGGVVRSPMPAIVLSILVEPGDEVAAGDRIAILEAMKMEIPVEAPFAGRVREVLAGRNVQVGVGAPLLSIETGASAVASSSPAVPMRVPPAREASTPAERWARCQDDLRRYLLGFDFERSEARRLIAAWRELAREKAGGDAEVRRGEEEILQIFVDIHALLRRQREAEGASRSTGEYLLHYLRAIDAEGAGLPDRFLAKLRRALAHYGVQELRRSDALTESLLRIHKSHAQSDDQVEAILAILERRLDAGPTGEARESLREVLDRLVALGRTRLPALHDLAREVRYRYFEQPMLERVVAETYAQCEVALGDLETSPERRDARLRWLVDCPQPLAGLLTERAHRSSSPLRPDLIEVLTRRYYRIRALSSFEFVESGSLVWGRSAYEHEGRRVEVHAAFAPAAEVPSALEQLGSRVRDVPEHSDVVADLYVWDPNGVHSSDLDLDRLTALLAAAPLPRPVRRLVVALAGPGGGRGIGAMRHYTFRSHDGAYAEDPLSRGLHPMMGKRLRLERLAGFELERLPSVDDIYLFHGVARDNEADVRLFALAEVRDATPLRDDDGRVIRLPLLERQLMEALDGIRRFQARRRTRDRLQWNRVLLYVWPDLDLAREDLERVARSLAPATEGLDLEEVAVRARIRDDDGHFQDTLLRVFNPVGRGIQMAFDTPSDEPVATLTPYQQKVARLRRRGLTYPYELIRMLTPPHRDTHADLPPGEFVEYDLDEAGELAPVARPHGENEAHVVAGLLRNFTARHPEGMLRVALFGDPSKEMGSVAEPECRRIVAALNLAERLRVPLEWFTLSAGAKISMESGTENMDWVARVLRRLIEFTQAGGEVNVVVCGINVGAQPYWNAEATMLMHTRGILVMTPESAMVLTGKQALDYSGSVSAADNQGIGGYEAIMGPNGQAQYWAEDLAGAAGVLLAHYEYTYVHPGERFPRRIETGDPVDRDIGADELDGADGFRRVGEIFEDATNPGRKRPFSIRPVLRAVVDRDHEPLERWRDMADAEVAVVWDGAIGGWPVCLIGLESHPQPRLGFVPADGPELWTAGTLFPRASKKVARAINGASGNRPVVVLANLSGFDGSPESMRRLQLEFGAEIGRAVVNFEGPVVFCVISRYHGGAFVVFSRHLNDNFEAAALEGSHASVIGGAPAAAVVFAREVEKRARADPRVQEIEAAIQNAEGDEKLRLRTTQERLYATVRSEKLGEVADEFDRTHSVERALEVGSLDRIVPARGLRPYLVEALERGMRREDGWNTASG